MLDEERIGMRQGHPDKPTKTVKKKLQKQRWMKVAFPQKVAEVGFDPHCQTVSPNASPTFPTCSRTASLLAAALSSCCLSEQIPLVSQELKRSETSWE